jgi:putative two-component system response regulator
LHAKIMVIDDSKLERKLLAAFLKPQNYEIIEADGGPHSIELVRAHRPDLVLLDLILDGITGLEICTQLKKDEELRLIPVVMVTAYGDKQSRVKGLEAGADDFLIKPVDRAELVARVKSSLKVKAYHEYARLKDYYHNLELAVREKTSQLENALKQIKEANVSLTQAYLDTLYRLSIAAEYRDDDTAGHIKRISHYSLAISRSLGLPSALCEMISQASPLHDVGKIGIPDKVLLKPCKLTWDEWQIMKQHTIIGANILAGSDNKLLQIAEQIALSHHEKFDGSGYPYGLAGQKIPLTSRIVTLADVFDALTSKRIYKPIFSVSEAVKIIKDSTGSHFDPEITNAFFKVFDDILSIKEQFKDEKAGHRYLQKVGLEQEHGIRLL